MTEEPRRYFIPEVMQTSGMDCGPAALKSLLAGFDIACNYEKLRDACRTGADGTSIDALEDICTELGLEAFQEIGPVSDAVAVLARAAPALVVVKGPGGSPHFVVLWRAVGKYFQLMDPARGRRWVRQHQFVSELHNHEQVFDEETLHKWFPNTFWGAILRERLAAVGSNRTLEGVRSWFELSILEGGSTLVERLVLRGALPRQAAAPLLESFMQSQSPSVGEGDVTPHKLPSHLRNITLRKTDDTLIARGFVFLVIRRGSHGGNAVANATEPSELARKVLNDQSLSLSRVLLSHLSSSAKHMALLVAILSGFLAVLTFVEMFLLRAAFNAPTLLVLPQQRFFGAITVAVVVLALLAVDFATGTHVARLGRAFELRCRIALLEKLPKLPDKYFRTRPMSDVTHRSQGLFMLRSLPHVLVDFTKVSLDLIVTTVALLFVHPRGAPFILLALIFGLVAPYFSLRIRNQLETRVQAHASGLSQLYLDVLLGLNPLRTHGGQLVIRARQNEQLADWCEESQRTITVLSITEGIQQTGTLLAVCLILGSFIRQGGEPGVLLVLAFWALKLPVQARALSLSAQHVPQLAASLARLLEPLTAEEVPPPKPAEERTVVRSDRVGLNVEVRNAHAVLGTHAVLDDVSVRFRSGEHVAIVGSSGAGKSSLLAAMLGLIELNHGSVRVDGLPIESYDLARFRRETVWVDPSVQLWNRSLLENLVFGNPYEALGDIGSAMERAELTGLLERLAEGMATTLGESGARVSGGEGQRIRLARSVLRRGARLILLDEAFRGLERSVRKRVSTSIRRNARRTTLIEVTHDVADTLDFDRVLVIENGRLMEQGEPSVLLADPESRYSHLVAADRETLGRVWSDPSWKRIHVANGHVTTTMTHGPETERQLEPFE